MLVAATCIYCLYPFALDVELIILKKLLDFSVCLLKFHTVLSQPGKSVGFIGLIGLRKIRFNNVSNLMTNSNIIQIALLFQFLYIVGI